MEQKNEKIIKELQQAIRASKGKISLYSEYIIYKEHSLKEQAEKNIKKFKGKQQVELDKINFYLLSEEEVFNDISKKYVEEKKASLRLKYRKMRESNKREIAKDPSKKEELDKKLSDYQVALDKELEEYKLLLKNNVVAEREKNASKYDSKYFENKKAQLNSQLEEFSKKEYEKVERELLKTKTTYQKRIEKEKEKLTDLEVKFIDALKQREGNFEIAEDEVLSVKDLCMYFGGLKAVDHLNFSVKKGEVFGLIGPNGAGKTTVFNCITQFNKPTAGEIIFKTKENNVINLNNEKVHDIISLGIARTFQNVEVVRECTVLENLIIAALCEINSTLVDHILYTGKVKMEEEVIKRRAFKVLEFMGLMPYAYSYAMGLPYGVLKKIEIARTLMTNPQLIILDEPAAGLNDNETKDLEKLILRIKEEYNCSILLVEHDMGLVMSICDRICVISFGKYLTCGTPEEVQANQLVQEAYLGSDDEEE